MAFCQGIATYVSSSSFSFVGSKNRLKTSVRTSTAVPGMRDELDFEPVK